MSQKGTHLHFVGIGGIGMSGIAEVFLNQGHLVSGSDLSDSEITRKLKTHGAKIIQGHHAENVHGAKVVVVSSAIRADNPEVMEAKRLRIPVIPRAEMLGELMRGKTGIAVAGSHGKTTTTSMLATVLTHAKLDPTLVIGGKVDSLGGNAKLGQGQWVVAEADESDGSFLHLPATYGVVTNIDNDHLDHFKSLDKVEEAFLGFVGKLPFYGLAAVCGEDPGVQRCLSRWTKPIRTYGLSSQWDVYADEIELKGLGSTFVVFARESGSTDPHQKLGTLEVNVPGRHNVLNALATWVIAESIGLTFAEVKKGIAEFRGVKRRFEVRWKDPVRNIVIVDDYGHHPTEITATLGSARSYWSGRVITVFQPHRFSRTLHCYDGFLKSLQLSDSVVLTDIYSAGEDPIEGVTAERLVKDLKELTRDQLPAVYAKDLDACVKAVMDQIQPGDMLLCMGAGTITRLPEKLQEALQ